MLDEAAAVDLLVEADPQQGHQRADDHRRAAVPSPASAYEPAISSSGTASHQRRGRPRVVVPDARSHPHRHSTHQTPAKQIALTTAAPRPGTMTVPAEAGSPWRRAPVRHARRASTPRRPRPDDGLRSPSTAPSRGERSRGNPHGAPPCHERGENLPHGGPPPVPERGEGGRDGAAHGREGAIGGRPEVELALRSGRVWEARPAWRSGPGQTPKPALAQFESYQRRLFAPRPADSFCQARRGVTRARWSARCGPAG